MGFSDVSDTFTDTFQVLLFRINRILKFVYYFTVPKQYL